MNNKGKILLSLIMILISLCSIISIDIFISIKDRGFVWFIICFVSVTIFNIGVFLIISVFEDIIKQYKNGK